MLGDEERVIYGIYGLCPNFACYTYSIARHWTYALAKVWVCQRSGGGIAEPV